MYAAATFHSKSLNGNFMRKHVSRFPNERSGEALIDWEERELMKKAKKLGIKLNLINRKTKGLDVKHARI